MSEWRDRKQAASFRGVPFWVDTDNVPVGRRTQVHEYPQRDQPYTEDMGRQTRKYRFSGFVVGDDCLSQRDRLLTALDKPGAGELLHPWFGRLTVTAGECEVSHARDEGGMVRLGRKSTRLNSRHLVISYAVFCLKKKRFEKSKKCTRSERPDT